MKEADEILDKAIAEANELHFEDDTQAFIRAVYEAHYDYAKAVESIWSSFISDMGKV